MGFLQEKKRKSIKDLEQSGFNQQSEQSQQYQQQQGTQQFVQSQLRYNQDKLNQYKQKLIQIYQKVEKENENQNDLMDQKQKLDMENNRQTLNIYQIREFLYQQDQIIEQEQKNESENIKKYYEVVQQIEDLQEVIKQVDEQLQEKVMEKVQIQSEQKEISGQMNGEILKYKEKLEQKAKEVEIQGQEIQRLKEEEKILKENIKKSEFCLEMIDQLRKIKILVRQDLDYQNENKQEIEEVSYKLIRMRYSNIQELKQFYENFSGEDNMIKFSDEVLKGYELMRQKNQQMQSLIEIKKDKVQQSMQIFLNMGDSEVDEIQLRENEQIQSEIIYVFGMIEKTVDKISSLVVKWVIFLIQIKRIVFKSTRDEEFIQRFFREPLFSNYYFSEILEKRVLKQSKSEIKGVQNKIKEVFVNILGQIHPFYKDFFNSQILKNQFFMNRNLSQNISQQIALMKLASNNYEFNEYNTFNLKEMTLKITQIFLDQKFSQAKNLLLYLMEIQYLVQENFEISKENIQKYYKELTEQENQNEKNINVTQDTLKTQDNKLNLQQYFDFGVQQKIVETNNSNLELKKLLNEIGQKDKNNFQNLKNKLKSNTEVETNQTQNNQNNKKNNTENYLQQLLILQQQAQQHSVYNNNTYQNMPTYQHQQTQKYNDQSNQRIKTDESIQENYEQVYKNIGEQYFENHFQEKRIQRSQSHRNAFNQLKNIYQTKRKSSVNNLINNPKEKEKNTEKKFYPSQNQKKDSMIQNENYQRSNKNPHQNTQSSKFGNKNNINNNIQIQTELNYNTIKLPNIQQKVKIQQEVQFNTSNYYSEPLKNFPTHTINANLLLRLQKDNIDQIKY